jgi:ribonuclease T1
MKRFGNIVLALCLFAAGGIALAQGPVGDVPLASLPQEARAMLALIKSGGPFAHAQDGSTFGNRERLLPAQGRGYYREYTVKTPGASDRGARRIVAGRGAAEYYYTDDHYNSFRRIRE